MVNRDLVMVQAEAARLGLRAIASEGWLVGGFLADATFTPQRYLDAAKRQHELQRVLFALTEALLTMAPLRLVA
jgi:hypothetical protein